MPHQHLPNMGWLYFKDYYQGFDFLGVKDMSKEQMEAYTERWFNGSRDQADKLPKQLGKNGYLFRQTAKTDYTNHLKVESAQYIELKTTYPGLASGLGLRHETGTEQEAKLGLVFDHATGYPFIPGSSVKGLLRSAFPQRVNKQKKKKLEQRPGYFRNHIKFIRSLLNTQGIKKAERHKRVQAYLDQKGLEENMLPKTNYKYFVHLLELELFEGAFFKKSKDGNTAEKAYHSLYQRDTFLDAYFPRSEHRNGQLLGSDFITPHPHPLKNPKPLMFIKVMPNVVVHFQFKLQDSVLLSAAEKWELFLDILLHLGIGAKTNVGYGQLEKTKHTENEKPKFTRTNDSEDGSEMGSQTSETSDGDTPEDPPGTPEEDPSATTDPPGEWKRGKKLTVIVKNTANRQLTVTLKDYTDAWHQANPVEIPPISYPASSFMDIGQKLQATLKEQPRQKDGKFLIILGRDVKRI